MSDFFVSNFDEGKGIEKDMVVKKIILKLEHYSFQSAL